MSLTARTEIWETKDGQTLHVPVGPYEVVEVSYELLAQMLADLGHSKVETVLPLTPTGY